MSPLGIESSVDGAVVSADEVHIHTSRMHDQPTTDQSFQSTAMFGISRRSADECVHRGASKKNMLAS
jgi:hypothetical protein